MYRLQKWYENIPLKIALSCEYAVRSGAILPEDMLQYVQPIERAVEQSSLELMALTLWHLISMNTTRIAHINGIGASKAKVKWSGMDLWSLEGEKRTEALHKQLLEAGKFAAKEMRYAKRWMNPDMVLCHQVYATPSGFIWEGQLFSLLFYVYAICSAHLNHSCVL
jgi:hypothetical protein